MIIWRGRGILVLILGMGAAAPGCRLHGDHPGWRLSFPTTGSWSLPCWAGAAACADLRHDFGKTEEKILLDPATHQPVRLRTIHSLYGGYRDHLGWLAVAAAIYATFLALTSPSGGSRGLGSGRASTDTGFANGETRLINAFDGGAEVYGNTGAATKTRRTVFAAASRKDASWGLKKGRSGSSRPAAVIFSPTASLMREHCAFLVHVPDIRHFKEDAKEWLAKTCWCGGAPASAPRPILFRSIWRWASGARFFTTAC